MKKALLMLAAIGMIAASATAQTQRVNRTNSRQRTGTTTTIISADENQRAEEAAKDGTRFPANGANGVDGTINNRANSGNNNSSSIQPDHGNDPNAGYSQPATPATIPGTTR